MIQKLSYVKLVLKFKTFITFIPAGTTHLINPKGRQTTSVFNVNRLSVTCTCDPSVCLQIIKII